MKKLNWKTTHDGRHYAMLIANGTTFEISSNGEELILRAWIGMADCYTNPIVTFNIANESKEFKAAAVQAAVQMAHVSRH